MAYRFIYRGIEVSCPSVEEVDALLDSIEAGRPPGPAIDHTGDAAPEATVEETDGGGAPIIL